MPVLLEANDLVKHFGAVKAVDGVSFAIEQGICFGLLGPNGAGKTTTVEVLEVITEPTSGMVSYKGEPRGPRFREEAGIMFQSTALQEFITVRETLRLFQRLYPHHAAIDDLAAQCSLGEFLERDNHKLSGGQRQRLLLAVALVNNPEILFLDEPTTGLDPQARRNFWRLIEEIKARGKTIVLTTHYMEEAYRLCDTIAIMDHGRIIASGTPRELLAAHFNEVIVHLPRNAISAGDERLPQAALHRHGGIEIPTTDVNATLRDLLRLDADLSHLQVRQPTLEDLFLELTGKELRG